MSAAPAKHSPDKYASARGAVFHVMTKPSGAACNLDCRYCFYLQKETLYPGSQMRMPLDTLERYIRQMFAAHAGPEIPFAWQGGEPTLMGLDFFEEVIRLQKRFAPPEKVVSNSIQTNGMLLDEGWCRFLAENNFLVGLSMDGPPSLHDLYRVDKGGSPTHAQVLRAANLLTQHDVEFNILCTVHAGNGESPLEVYRYFRDSIKAQYIQFIPIVERINTDGSSLLQQGDTVSERSIKPLQWGDFLMAVFDEWIKRDVGKVFVQMFDAALASWAGAPAGMCIFAETCGHALALEHNGDLYSCDHFVEPNFLLGNIHHEQLLALVRDERQIKFGAAKRDSLPQYCRDCEVRFACHGECPKNRFIATPQGRPGLNYLCAGYKAFFKHIDRPMKVMASLLSRGRPPANVMHLLAMERLGAFQQAMANASPKDPCPCGSGRIYKACHGRAKRAGRSRI